MEYIFTFCLELILPVDCIWAPWNSWSDCNKECGGGTRIKERTKSVTEAYGGICLGASTDSEDCNIQTCPGLILHLT